MPVRLITSLLRGHASWCIQAGSIACTGLVAAACGGKSLGEGHGALSTIDSLDFAVVSSFGPRASAEPVGKAATSAPIQDAIPPLMIAPRSAGVSQSGEVFVLDTQARRIYLYQPDGHPSGAIGAIGEGPGEMAQPISFSLTSEDALVVSDIQLRRVTTYDPVGNLLSTTPVTRNGLTALRNGSEITMLTDFGPSSTTALIRYSLEGEIVSEFGEPSRRDKEFARGGQFGWLTTAYQPGRILLFSGAPGTWTPYDSLGRSIGRRGVELFPAAGFAQLPQDDGFPLSYTTAGTVTAGLMGNDGQLFIAYFSDLDFGTRLPAKHDYRWGVALFDSAGALLAKGSLPSDWGPLRAAAAGQNGNLLFTLSEPEPHVAEVRIRRIPQGVSTK